MKKLLILLAVFSTYAFADNWGQLSKHGVIIRPLENTNAPLEYKAGDRAIYEGDICTVSEGHFKNGKEECKKLNGKLEIRAFFPNPTVDITDQIKITKKFNSYYYSFKTPPLKAGDSNTLTVIVGPLNNHLKDLLKTKAKLDHQIDFINKRISKYNLSNKSQKYVSSLKFILQKLVSVANKINAAIEKEPLVIAKFSRPLQVEADSPAPYYYHSTFDGQRLALNIPEGLPKTDEELTISAKITNLSYKDAKKKYKAKLYIDEILSHESNDFLNPMGKSFVYNHSLSNHQEGRSRKVKLELYSLLKSNSGKSKNSKPNYELVGKIILPLPAPLKGRDQDPPNIALELQDNLKINDNKLLLSGTINDKSNVKYALFLNNQLVIESGSKQIEHELALNQGLNNIKIIAQDTWGNSAQITRIIQVDSILPIISNTQNFSKLTNQQSFRINAQIFDQNHVMSKIIHNGQVVHSSELKDFTFIINLVEGSNSIKIESIDDFGNMALPFEISGIVLDSAPPAIAFTHSPAIPNPDQEITIDASASSDLSGIKNYSIHASGTLLASSTSNQIKIKIQNSGDHQITVTAEDNAGNLSSFKKTIHINVPPVASLTATPVTGSAPLLVELDASASSDDGILTYQYNFGDGSPTLITNVNRITHEYQAGSYTASVKVVDLQGLESNSTIEIQSLTPSAEDAPQINIVTKNAYDLYLNYLQGSPIELDATSSTGGNGEIVHYEWKKDDEVIGNGRSVALPSDSIGQYNYSLSITNTNNLTSKETFVISISPNVTPEIAVDQPNNFSPSFVSTSLANENSFAGIKNLNWKNAYTGEKYTGQTFSQTITHVGETRIELEIEDNYGHIYFKEVVIDVQNDGPFIEGPQEVDVVLGIPNEFKYIISGDSTTTTNLKDAVAGVSLDKFGVLNIDVNEAPTGLENITLVASNGLRVFEKEIKVNWLTPTLLATIPGGFYGTYIINAPDSLLDKTQVQITEEMTNGTTEIKILEAKSNNKNYLVTKSDNGELNHPIQISLPPSILASVETDHTISQGEKSAEEVYVDNISACFDKRSFQKSDLKFADYFSLPKRKLETIGGLKVTAIGNIFQGPKETDDIYKLINAIAQTFDRVMYDKSKTIYLIEKELMTAWNFPLAVDGLVPAYDTTRIFINIDSALNKKWYNFFKAAGRYDTTKEAYNYFSTVLFHENNHTYLNSRMNCARKKINSPLLNFILESQANHYSIKFSNEEQRKAFFKYGIYNRYHDNYFNLMNDTIEDSFEFTESKWVNTGYIFSGVWDLIDPESFIDWTLTQEYKYKNSTNSELFNDFLKNQGKSFPVFLMDYEYKMYSGLGINDQVINTIARSLVIDLDTFREDLKKIIKFEEITLKASSADRRIINRSYLNNNNMYNADGFAFLEIAFDDTIGIHARMENNPGNGYFLHGESGYSNENDDDNDGEDDSKIIRLYENNCDQCELILANVASTRQNITVTTYGATKIENDPKNFEPRLNESSTDDPWTQWPNILIKHYYPWEEEEVYSWVDPGNALYVNHLMPVHVYACTPIDFEEGDDSIIRDFSYDCGWQELNLSIENNYKITLTNCFTPLFEGDVHVGFTANGTETCHYETSIIPSGETAVVKGSNPLKSFLKSLSDIFAPPAYAHMHLIPTRPNPEELFGIKTENKRQVRQ